MNHRKLLRMAVLTLAVLVLPAVTVAMQDRLANLSSNEYDWQSENVDYSYPEQCALVLDGEDNPHIAYNGTGELRYARHDGTSWQVEKVEDSDGMLAANSALALDSEGHPHLTYYDLAEQSVKYVWYDGSSWYTDTLAYVGLWVSVSSSAIAIDQDSHPHIVYEDTGVKYAWHDGNDWQIEDVENGEDVGGHLTMSLDDSGSPHIAYLDASDYSNTKVKYAWHEGDGWHIDTVDSGLGSLLYVEDWISLILDSSMRPHLSYCAYPDDVEGRTLKYAWHSDSSWHIENVWPGDACPSSLVLDASGRPHIAFASGGHVYWDGASWQYEQVDVWAGDAVSIGIETDNRLHMCYNDDLYRGLNYALGTESSPSVGLYVSKSSSVEAPPGPHEWIAMSTGISNTLMAVFFTDAETGWVVGDDGVILYTADGGLSWHTQNSGSTDELRDVHFLDGDRGWAVGGDDLVLRTTDGGVTWTTQSVTTGNYELNAIHFSDDQHGWIVGGKVVVKSLYPLNTYYLAGVFVTTDGGNMWGRNTSQTPHYWLRDVHFVDELNGWAGGVSLSSNFLYDIPRAMLSSSGGRYWSGGSTPVSMGELYGLDFVDAQTGWAVGYDQETSVGMILHTTDAGGAWEQQQSNMTGAIRAVDFLDEDIGWAISSDTILHTADGGEHWVPESVDISPSSLQDVFLLDAAHGWAVGGGGKVYKYAQSQVEYGDQVTYTVVVSATSATQVGLYDPLADMTYLRFVEQPTGITHGDGIITGSLTVAPSSPVTVSFVAQVEVPTTGGQTASVTNRACVYPVGNTLDQCVWSNEVTDYVNAAAQEEYRIYLPLIVRD